MAMRDVNLGEGGGVQRTSETHLVHAQPPKPLETLNTQTKPKNRQTLQQPNDITWEAGYKRVSALFVTYLLQKGPLAIPVSLSRLAHLSTLSLMHININLFLLC